MIKKIYLLSYLVILTWAPCVSCSAITKEKDTTEVEKDSLAILTEKATNGDAHAQNLLGLWYYSGKNVEQNYKTALDWWAKSAQQDNVNAIANMALCYQLGRGTEKDSAMAINLYLSAIKKGNESIIPQHEALIKNTGSLFSNRLMYECYKRGIGVKRDDASAVPYLENLAKGGDVNSQFTLALHYLNDKQASEAAKWFKKAADADKTEAIYYYGYLLYKGMGVPQDKEKGIEYIQKAADRGFAAAHRELGTIYYTGDGATQDYAKAVAHLKQAAGSNGQAAWTLAMCYLNGYGVPQDYYFATQWIAEYVRAHEKDFNDLMDENKDGDYNNYILGLKKYYIDKDYDAALSYFKKVKNVEGLTMTGVCQANKNYAKRNTKKAAKTFDKAINKGSAVACYYLSSMYETGEGVAKDKSKAIELLKKAAEGGVAYAQCKLGDKYFTGDGVSQDYNQATKCYLAAEAQNRLTKASATNLITCYERQISSLPDLNDAEKRIEELKKVNDNNKVTQMLSFIKE